jgi:hypothetical protein
MCTHMWLTGDYCLSRLTVTGPPHKGVQNLALFSTGYQVRFGNKRGSFVIVGVGWSCYMYLCFHCV